MSGQDHPDAPPPEVPEEFADAYRDAYRRALESDPAFASQAGAEAGAGVGSDVSPEPTDELFGVWSEVPPQEVVAVGTHRTGAEHVPADRWAGLRAARWFVPAVMAASALVLVGAAYAVGVALSGDDEPDKAGPVTAVRTTEPARSGSPSDRPTSGATTTAPGGWDGPVTAVSVDAISADCTAPPSNDSAGRRVTYDPENAIDGKTQTAWRCAGTAVGQTLTLRLAGDTDIARVGLIPGYAKTDPASGVDRYAENNRITRVRWTLADGVTVVQRLDPDPTSRAMQLLRVPRTTTDTLTLEILEAARGQRNTTAISEIATFAAG
jgi:hypothetical protein